MRLRGYFKIGEGTQIINYHGTMKHAQEVQMRNKLLYRSAKEYKAPRHGA